MSEPFVLFVEPDPSAVFDALRKPGFTKMRNVDSTRLFTGEIGFVDCGFRFIVSKPVSFARLNRRGPISRWKLKR